MSVLRLGHRVNLDLGSIFVLEDLVEVDEGVGGLLLGLLRLEAKLLGKIKGGLLVQAFLEVDWSGNDGGWILGRDLLDVHATLGGSNEHRAGSCPVIENSNVVLM